MSYYLFFILCLSVFGSLSHAQQNAPCKSYNGELGACISIKLCAPLLNILKQSRTNPELRNILQASECGRGRSNDPLVCCPGARSHSSENFDTNKPIDTNLCGVSGPSVHDQRIVGGFDAERGQFPWNVALGYKKDTNDVQFRCGGSIISHRHILTAGHCITDDLYSIRYGVLNLYDDPPRDILIEEIRLHEDYQQSPKILNDIAILKVAEDIIFSDDPWVRPVCLPETSMYRSNLFENSLPYIAGWGALWYRGPSTNKLKALQTRVVPNDDCTDVFRKHKQALIDNRIICAGDIRGGRDSCQGDSGGPLMLPRNVNNSLFQFYQIGIISYGYGCAEPGYVGVYTRVTAFMDWINQSLK